MSMGTDTHTKLEEGCQQNRTSAVGEHSLGKAKTREMHPSLALNLACWCGHLQRCGWCELLGRKDGITHGAGAQNSRPGNIGICVQLTSPACSPITHADVISLACLSTLPVPLINPAASP